MSSWWDDVIKAAENAVNPAGAIASDISSLGGQAINNALDTAATDIWHGIYTATTNVLTDLWSTIEGPVLIFTAIGLFLIAMVLLFQGQIMAAAPMIAALA